jgi:hypothetical protein
MRELDGRLGLAAFLVPAYRQSGLLKLPQRNVLPVRFPRLGLLGDWPRFGALYGLPKGSNGTGPAAFTPAADGAP